MTIPELNTYLRSNIKSSVGDFLSCNPYEDEYDYYRRDAEIYCYSSAWSVSKQTSNSDNYANYILDMARHTVFNYDSVKHRNEIANLAYQSVKSDGDDLCDEQSVGWYIGVHTYVHCLAFGTYNFREIFISSWNKYFSVEFQDSIRNIRSNSEKRISMDDILAFIKDSDNFRSEIIDLKYKLRRIHYYSYNNKEEFTDALCNEAHNMYLLKPDQDYLFSLMQAVNVVYYEETDEIYNINGLCILANKILNGCD